MKTASNLLWRALLPTLLLLSDGSAAAVFEFDEAAGVVGETGTTIARAEQTLPDIARQHGLGYREIKRANPEVDTWLPGEGTEVILPTRFVLPAGPREGIVINIPEMRLYYYPKTAEGQPRQVVTHAIGIGREGWATPYITTTIIQKNRNPSWYPPESIRAEHAKNGDILPKVVKPGPDNPLGAFAMRLGLPSYLIHGTNRPYGVGMRVSSGCIRLYPEDIESLFAQVPMGTKVRIVNQPYKVGILEDRIYLQASPFLDEDAEQFDGNLTSVVKMLFNLPEDTRYDIDWDLAKVIIDERNGVPVQVGRLYGSAAGAFAVTGNAESGGNTPALRLETVLGAGE